MKQSKLQESVSKHQITKMQTDFAILLVSFCKKKKINNQLIKSTLIAAQLILAPDTGRNIDNGNVKYCKFIAKKTHFGFIISLARNMVVRGEKGTACV